MFHFLKAGELPKLTPEEEERPYASYYYRDPVLPAEEVRKELVYGQPIDERQAVRPENVNVMLDGRYMERESGYCVFLDGIGYGAAHTLMPDMTPEMFVWFSKWHEREDLRYKIWFPGAHFMVGNRWVKEDVGIGPAEYTNIQPLSAEVIGFEGERVKADKSILAIRGQSDWVRLADHPEQERPYGMSVMHMIRILPQGGIELRSRFRLGVHFFGGKAVRVLPEGRRVPPEAAYCFAEHGAYEMAAMNAVVPELFRRFREIP